MDLRLRNEPHGPTEQRARRPLVAAPPHPHAGACQPARSLLRESGLGPAELGEIEGGLLEVVTEDLVELDKALPVLLEPRGKAAMQIGAGRLGESVVGRVPDEEMAEAVGVLAGKQGPIG